MRIRFYFKEIVMWVRTTIRLQPVSLYAHFIEGLRPCTCFLLDIIKYPELSGHTFMTSKKIDQFCDPRHPPSAKLNKRYCYVFGCPTFSSSLDTFLCLQTRNLCTENISLFSEVIHLLICSQCTLSLPLKRSPVFRGQRKGVFGANGLK